MNRLRLGQVVIAAFGAVVFAAFAECKHGLPVKGAESIKGCDPKTQACEPAQKAMGEYLEKIKEDPALFTAALYSSPWRLYDGGLRILTVKEFAALVQSGLAKKKATAKRVELVASWTGVSPEQGRPSIAEALSKELGGFPVTGAKGFIWVRPDGSVRTTQQAMTMRMGGGYYVAKGDEVMASATVAWAIEMTQDFRAKRDAKGLAYAGAAWDIYGLCPQNALAAFEQAAEFGSPVGAYNAALMRLESGSKDDKVRAAALLKKAADAGDAKAKERLQGL